MRADAEAQVTKAWRVKNPDAAKLRSLFAKQKAQLEEGDRRGKEELATVYRSMSATKGAEDNQEADAAEEALREEVAAAKLVAAEAGERNAWRLLEEAKQAANNAAERERSAIAEREAREAAEEAEAAEAGIAGMVKSAASSVAGGVMAAAGAVASVADGVAMVAGGVAGVAGASVAAMAAVGKGGGTAGAIEAAKAAMPAAEKGGKPTHRGGSSSSRFEGSEGAGFACA
jgi:hypothetical protein